MYEQFSSLMLLNANDNDRAKKILIGRPITVPRRLCGKERWLRRCTEPQAFKKQGQCNRVNQGKGVGEGRTRMLVSGDRESGVN